MTKVLVLLSTYNGEKYLEEQLQSLVAQQGVEVDILVRDDGSTDRTCDILDEWQRRGALHWYTGENLGPARSFMDLLAKAPDAEYYAFCDQDDVWLPEKLECAVKALTKFSGTGPSIYVGTYTLVDSNLRVIGRRNDVNYRLTLPESFMYSMATGCTMAFNHKLRANACQIYSEYIEMHDIWLYRLCLALGGNAIYDYNSHILYRQHGNNVIGANRSRWSRAWKRLKFTISADKGPRWLSAKALLDSSKNIITADALHQLDMLANYKNSWKKKVMLITSSDFRTHSWKQNVKFKLAIILNKY